MCVCVSECTAYLAPITPLPAPHLLIPEGRAPAPRRIHDPRSNAQLGAQRLSREIGLGAQYERIVEDSINAGLKQIKCVHLRASPTNIHSSNFAANFGIRFTNTTTTSQGIVTAITKLRIRYAFWVCCIFVHPLVANTGKLHLLQNRLENTTFNAWKFRLTDATA